MQGIYYLLSILAVFIVFVWYISNDRLAEDEPTGGLLAMKEPTPPKRTNGATKAGSSSASAGGAVVGRRNQTHSHLRKGRMVGRG